MATKAWTDDGRYHKPSGAHPPICRGCTADRAKWGNPIVQLIRLRTRNETRRLVVEHDGEVLGEVRTAKVDGKMLPWVVLMPDGNGDCVIQLPDTYPTRDAAVRAVVDAHKPEGN